MALYVATHCPVFATPSLSRLLLATCILCLVMTGQKAILLVAAGMTYRPFTRDTPAEPSTPTLVFFTALLFALGALLKIIPLQPSASC
jgi:hypothetical protein